MVLGIFRVPAAITLTGFSAPEPELRIRGGTTHFWAFRDGRFSIVDELRRPDVVLSADPVACLLVFYSRRSQWPEILRGRMLAWGRRPWLALSFVKRFHQP